MTTFDEKHKAVRSRIDPFHLDDQEATHIIWAQSGQRWHRTDEMATAPTWSRIQFAIRTTEPETAKIRARQQAEEEQARQQADQEQELKEMKSALWMGVALVVLAIWIWLLALLPIHWAK
jgi:hypothetical protein